MILERYRMFAAYNSWANERIYDAAEKLSEEEYRRETGAFFKSLHRTLNHVLVGDRIWLSRFTGSGPLPRALDEELYGDLQSLLAARVAEDARIEELCEGLDEARLAAEFSYTPITNPKVITQQLAPVLDHFFNHQTHHRGQAHAILTTLRGGDFGPALDMVLFQRTRRPA